jgi:regulation of enolase protein 1 (concanavalin A-like superfamily)
VIHDAGQLTLWFYGETQDLANGLGRATSTNGLEWTSDDELALAGRPGTWEQSVNVPSILADGSGYRMWYAGYPGCSIGHATSVDGKLWTRDETNPIFTASQPWEGACGADTPSVLFDGEVYRLWFAAGSELDSGKIGYATSTDGLSWTKYAGNPVLREGAAGVSRGAGLPCVLFDQTTSRFEMWYAIFETPDLARTSIAYAASMDGMAWAKHPGSPVLAPAGGELDVFRPSVLLDGSEYRMWYTTLIAGRWGISYATAPWNTPRASFSATHAEAFDGELVGFDASRSVSPNGEIASYRWDFGDGATAEGVTASHAYARPGHYTVTLTALDGAGKEGSVARAIDVKLRPGDLAPWTAVDVGEQVLASGARFTGDGEGRCLDAFTREGDIGSRSDSFHFVERELAGDFTLTTRIASVAGTSLGAKVGLMVREGLAADARHAAVVVQGAAGGLLRLLSRLTIGAATRLKGGPAIQPPPAVWLRLERRESVITAFTSADGELWSQVDEPVSFDPPLGATILAGLAVSSGRAGLEGGYQDLLASACNLEVSQGIGPFLRGDCNGDGSVAGEVTDAVFLLAHSFTGGAAPPCLAACDSNADGAKDISDAVYLLSFNFLGGPAPTMPFPACGPSKAESDRALGCETALEGCP